MKRTRNIPAGASKQAIFATQLSEWRKAQNLTISALAAKVGTNRVSVRHWENGVSFPSDKFCTALYGIAPGLICFGPEREAARAEHERLIPSEVRKKRSAEYYANAEVRRARAMTRYHNRHEAQRQFVDTAQLDALRKDPRQNKNVCRECGEILRDVGPHIGQAHKMTADVYKKKWGFLRSRNATRSPETQAKQSAAMKRGRREPPRWTRDLLPVAHKASLKANRPGLARLEERLNARGRKLEARPQYWKRTAKGVITDAQIAQLRLAGESVAEIAAALSMSETPVFNRLRRMGFAKRSRAFLHGEPIGWKHIISLYPDFGLTKEQLAERIHVSADWLCRTLKPKRKSGTLSAELAKRFLKVRSELLAAYRRKPASAQGGRPKQLPPSEQAELPAKYDALRAELSLLRRWLREQEPAPKKAAVWAWLCDLFRADRLPLLRHWPQFFSWLEKNCDSESFASGNWIPRDLTIQFLAGDFGASESTIDYIVTHSKPQVCPESVQSVPV